MTMLAHKVAGTLGPLALAAMALPVSAQTAQTAPLNTPAATTPGTPGSNALPPMEEIHLATDSAHD
ncbi:hypothetical protein ACFS32_18760 [Novosphingobium pokkalii]|uniref:hypothetical protein n=1 Tax=Novosphingobium pokkalii TaxID=1770194 RepID=UPI003628DDB3